MNKTILYIRTDIYAQELVAGGSVTHTLGVLQGFYKLGYNILCASSAMVGILQKSPYNAKFKKLQNPTWLQFLRIRINSIISNFFFTRQLLSFIKNNVIDCMYQRYSLLNFSGVLVSTIKKIPLILEYNGSEIWVDQHWRSKKWWKFTTLARMIENLNFKRAHLIVVVSEALKEELIHRGVDASKIIVNPNGVDVEAYDPHLLEQKRHDIRKQLNIENKYVLTFVGTFGPWHGINILKELIPEIVTHNSKVHFLLVGDGPLKAELAQELHNKKLTNQVTFTGTVSHEKVVDYLAASDAFLCPTQPNSDGSRFFGSPTKLFEYLSLAKPVIASDLEQLSLIINPARKTGSTEQIKNEVGILVAPYNANCFVATVQSVIALSIEEQKIMGANARNHVIQNYTWHRHVEKIHHCMMKKELYVNKK